MNTSLFWSSRPRSRSAACNSHGRRECRARSRRQAPGSASTRAGWTRSVAPGDDFFSYANGSWVKNTAIPADRSRIGGFYIADQRAREEHARAVRRSPQVQPDERHRRADRQLLQGVSQHRRDRPRRAWRRPRPTSTPSPRIADKQQLSAAIGGTLRADTDPLNATNFHTENLFGDFRHPGPRDAGRAAALSDAGRASGCPNANITSPPTPRWRTRATKYKAYVQTILQDAGYADPAGAAGRIMDLETKIAQGARAARAERGLRERRAGVDPPAARAEGAGDRLGGAARRRAARQCAEVRRLSFRRDPEARRAGRLGAASELEGLARLPHAEPAGERPAQAVPRRELRLLRHDACRDAAAAAARRARAQRDQQRAAGRGRQGLCRQIFPGFVQGRRSRGWSTTSRRPSRGGCRRSAGWRPRPSRKR